MQVFMARLGQWVSTESGPQRDIWGPWRSPPPLLNMVFLCPVDFEKCSRHASADKKIILMFDCAPKVGQGTVTPQGTSGCPERLLLCHMHAVHNFRWTKFQDFSMTKMKISRTTVGLIKKKIANFLQSKVNVNLETLHAIKPKELVEFPLVFLPWEIQYQWIY